MLGEHLRQPSIRHRTFVKVGTDQCDAARLQPRIHLGARKPPLRLLAAEQSARAVDRRIKRRLGLLAIDALDDAHVFPISPADESTLAWKCRRPALADDPQILAAVIRPPRVIVVVVNHVGHVAADDPADTLDHPLAAGIGVAYGELHRRDVAPSDFAVFVDHGRRHVHAVLAARGLEVARRAGVPEAAAAEVNADPDEAVLIAHQVDIVIARSDGAKLRDRLLPVRAHVRFAPGVVIIEQIVLDPLVIGSPDAERDRLVDVLDDRAGIAFDPAERRVETHGHVATADIEPDAGDADLLFIGDDAADRLRIAQMTVGADHARNRVADGHAIAHLRDRGVVVRAENPERAVLVLRGLRLDRDIGGDSFRIPGELLPARGGAQRAPDPHRALTP